MKTLLLDRTTWDLVVDSSRNIAVASSPYAVAQDVASAVKVFKYELWYDTSRGVPYFQEVIGKFSPALYAALADVEALAVPEVATAKTIIDTFKNRRVTGRVLITDTNGVSSIVTFGEAPLILATPSGRYVAPGYVVPNYVV
jgi:hypothetical protein